MEEKFGLTTLPRDGTDAYIAFRAAIRGACEIVDADVWDLASRGADWAGFIAAHRREDHPSRLGADEPRLAS